jgi:hypothetical protein
VEIVSNWDILRGTCIARYELQDPAQRLEVSDAVDKVLHQALVEGTADAALAAPAAYSTVRHALTAARCKLSVLSHYSRGVTEAALEQCGYDLKALSTVRLCAVRDQQDLYGGKQAGGEHELHVILDNFDTLCRLKDRLFGKRTAEAVREELREQWGRVSEGDVEQVRSQAFKLHLCEWTPNGVRGALALDPVMHMLSEVSLAELLNVQDVDTVMDGLSWQ